MLRSDVKRAGNSAVDPVINGEVSQFSERRAKLCAQIESPINATVITPALMHVKKKMSPSPKNRSSRPEWAARIEQLRKELGMNGTAFGEELGVSAMAISRWENGVNEPSGACYAIMGNIALVPKTRLYFWAQAGVDIDVLARTSIPRERKASPPLSRERPVTPITLSCDHSLLTEPNRFGIIDEMKNPHAVALGRKGGESGGRSTSEAKREAARANGQRGGRPKKQSPVKGRRKP
jgi:DNA-binding transcriptional regulator YiaG